MGLLVLYAGAPGLPICLLGLGYSGQEMTFGPVLEAQTQAGPASNTIMGRKTTRTVPATASAHTRMTSALSLSDGTETASWAEG